METFVYIYLVLMANSFTQIVNEKFNGISHVGLTLGLVTSAVATITWSLVMQFTLNSHCWLLNMEHLHHWINDSFRLVLLLIATFYFLKLLCRKDEIYKLPDQVIEVKFTTKLILVFCLPFFTMPLISLIIETCFGKCGFEEVIKLVVLSGQAAQTFSLSFIYISHPKVRKVFKNITKKISSNGSDASLAPSGVSKSSTTKDESEQINSWNDFVIRARSSICEGNVYSTEPSISSAPDPTSLKSKISLINRPNTSYQQYDPKRRPIRDIMHRAKGAVCKPSSATVQPIAKCVTPPLPKNIPNHILDDVQLFDFYYKNLNTVFINESPLNVSSTDPGNRI